LLDRWITGYGEILKPALTLGTFRFADKNMEVTWRQLPIERNATAWGGEPAAEAYTGYLRPEIFTIYTYEQKLDLLKRWKLIPDEKGNIKIY
ncbi:type IV toxin-antitoxin system AbiEi family antitoxin, partial [Acinetobacter baumannii]